MSTARGGAGGLSWHLTPQIGHKLDLCVCSVSSEGTRRTVLTSDNRTHGGDSVSDYSAPGADVSYHKK